MFHASLGRQTLYVILTIPPLSMLKVNSPSQLLSKQVTDGFNDKIYRVFLDCCELHPTDPCRNLILYHMIIFTRGRSTGESHNGDYRFQTSEELS